MAKSTVKRKRHIRSYAGFTTGAAKYTIVPLTENAEKFSHDRCVKVAYDTGALANSIHSDVRGLTGAVKSGGPGAKHANLVEYGTIYQKARSFMRYGIRKAKGELKKVWKDGLKRAEREQRV